MHIRRSHELGLDEARRRVDQIADEICERFDLTPNWHGDELRVSGPGVSGHIALAERSIEVIVRLSLALTLFKGTIRSAIEEAMDHHLS